MITIKRLESEVRGYCRSFPTLFKKAKGAVLQDVEGKAYIDFLSGAGTLNYGHNNEIIKEEVIEYLKEDGVLHGLDLATTAKQNFLKTFEELILIPRNLNYKVQFPGPTGTNAVEAAFKLARKVTDRVNIISFTNGFHGMTLGAVSATGNSYYRDGAGLPLSNTTFMPYDQYLGEDVDTLEVLEKMLSDQSSGVDLPAAFVVETVQDEGGVNVARFEWLRGLEATCREFGILLIVDDIQVGCGRTGTFFSFEEAGIYPDMVLLSKSLSGYGLPMAVVLMKPHLDQWKPGEHNGTFRGNNLAFVSAKKAMETYWSDDWFSREILAKSEIIRERLQSIVDRYPDAGLELRGRGMIYGVECAPPERGAEVSREAFQRGMIIETSGAESQVVKCLPPLTIEKEFLETGLDILSQSFEAVFGDSENESRETLVKTSDLVGAYE